MNTQNIKNMKTTFTNILRFISWDFKTLIIFEAIYKLILIIISPMIQYGLLSIMNKYGILYITNENFLQIITNPLILILLLIFIFLLAFYVYIEITAIILYCDYCINGKRTTPFLLLWESLKKSLNIFSPRNILMLPFIALIIPVTGFTLTSGILKSLKIPEFILDFIHENTFLLIAYYIFIALLLILLFRWIFSIHYVTLNGSKFPDACKNSISLAKGKLFKTLIYIILWLILVSAIASIFYYGMATVLILIIKLTTNSAESQSHFWMDFPLISSLLKILIDIFYAVCNVGLVTCLYYQYKGKFPNKISKKEKVSKSIFASVFTILLTSVILFLYLDSVDIKIYNPTRKYQTQVVAHRAGALFAPENTISALKEAKNAGSEFAEIDVQQTKDGAIIVMHDTNFKRTTGVNKNVWDTTLKEMKTFDVGKSFSINFPTERIPTLDEMISEAQNEIKLMIEIKKAPYQQNIEKDVLQLIKKKNFENQCIVASMDYHMLEEVKKINPNIKTVYISVLAYGDFKNMKAADAFSVEASFITQELIHNLQHLGKDIYVWTVNNEKSMKKIIDLDVNGIVTDNPYFASYIIETQGKDIIVESLVNKFLTK